MSSIPCPRGQYQVSTKTDQAEFDTCEECPPGYQCENSVSSPCPKVNHEYFQFYNLDKIFD